MRFTSGEVATIDARHRRDDVPHSAGDDRVDHSGAAEVGRAEDRAVNSISLTRCMSADLEDFQDPAHVVRDPRRDGVSAKVDSLEETTRSQEKTDSQAAPPDRTLHHRDHRARCASIWRMTFRSGSL